MQGSRDDIVTALRQKHKTNPRKVFEIESSHASLQLVSNVVS